MTDRWFDDAAGPVVRPYAMTRGRTRSSADEERLDLIALVIADDAEDGVGDAQGGGGQSSVHDALLDDTTLAPEHVDIVVLCRREPQSIAELATEFDLPVGVVRVLVGDLIDSDLVRVSRPVPPAELPDESILREVINGLRAL